MKIKIRLIWGVFWIVLGLTLTVLGIMGRIDSYWSGMGGGVLAVGVLQMVRYVKYMSNEEYREQTDVANKEERNRFISNKSWAWTGYLCVFICAAGSIVFKLIGREDLMMFASLSVCLILVVYWVCYLILGRKY